MKSYDELERKCRPVIGLTSDPQRYTVKMYASAAEVHLVSL